MPVSAHKNELSSRRQLWTGRAGGGVMDRLLWPETANCLAELLQLIPDWQLLRGGETVAWNRHGCAVDQLSRTALEVVLDGGPQSQQNPRQLVVPARTGQPGLEGVLEAAVEPLHEPIRLRVVRRGGREAHTQQRRHLRPEGGGKLCTSVRCHQVWDTEPGHPVVEQGGADGGGGGVGQGNRLGPTGVPVHYGEQVRETTGGGQGADQVYV